MSKTQERVEQLKKMDAYLREHIEDEEVFLFEWLANGVPDALVDKWSEETVPEDYEDEILTFLAKCDDTYIECLESFVRCCLLDTKGE